MAWDGSTHGHLGHTVPAGVSEGVKAQQSRRRTKTPLSSDEKHKDQATQPKARVTSSWTSKSKDRPSTASRVPSSPSLASSLRNQEHNDQTKQGSTPPPHPPRSAPPSKRHHSRHHDSNPADSGLKGQQLQPASDPAKQQSHGLKSRTANLEEKAIEARHSVAGSAKGTPAAPPPVTAAAKEAEVPQGKGVKNGEGASHSRSYWTTNSGRATHPGNTCRECRKQILRGAYQAGSPGPMPSILHAWFTTFQVMPSLCERDGSRAYSTTSAASAGRPTLAHRRTAAGTSTRNGWDPRPPGASSLVHTCGVCIGLRRPHARATATATLNECSVKGHGEWEVRSYGWHGTSSLGVSPSQAPLAASIYELYARRKRGGRSRGPEFPKIVEPVILTYEP